MSRYTKKTHAQTQTKSIGIEMIVCCVICPCKLLTIRDFVILLVILPARPSNALKLNLNNAPVIVVTHLSCIMKTLEMFSITKLLIDLSLVCILISRVDCFKCYVCDSKSDNECVENLPRNSKLKPQECSDLIEPKYCVKTTNMYAGKYSI